MPAAANSYLTACQVAAGAEARYPLHARVCTECWLIQVDDVVPAKAIFNADYAYFSSYSRTWVEHARRYAESMSDRLKLGPEFLVIEVASNDGYLLQHFVAMRIPVLGIEPTTNTAEAARAAEYAPRSCFSTRSRPQHSPDEAFAPTS